MPDLVLASSSPRRLMLLQQGGLDVVVRIPGCDETVHDQEAPIDHARRVARDKLVAGLDGHEPPLSGLDVLAADTVVWTDAASGPLGKPRDRDDAARMLGLLATGAEHKVTTAWALGRTPDDIEVHETTTRVFMRPLRPTEIAVYLEGDQWRDKAGGYAIQGCAAGWINRIEGSYTNVVGLPLCAVLERLWERSEARHE